MPALPPTDNLAATPTVPADGQELRRLQSAVHLQQRAISVGNVRELAFVVANETFQLLPYRQAFVWAVGASGQPQLHTVSGLANLAEDSPLTLWLRKLGKQIAQKVGRDGEYLQIADVPASAAAGWQEWLPEFLLCFALRDREGLVRAYVAFALEDAPAEQTAVQLASLVDSYGVSWGALAPKARARRRVVQMGRFAVWVLAVAAVLALFVPVRMSVLAPAEVIALEAIAVAAPMDGVIKTFAAQPNQLVKENELLFSLDEASLRNRREVALKSLAVARADAMAAQQKSFENDNSRAEMASLNGKVAERQAEVASFDDQLKRLDVRAPRAGVIVFGDVNDWQGKPVVTGERVALLADPKDAGVMVYLAVADAINLQAGAQVKLFLQIAPLKPLLAQVSQTSYQSVLSPEGVSAYRLRAKFSDLTQEQRELARIGLKGTAKLYGEKSPLGYYLFRRPISALRELTGW
jgi:multidrug resistance efflux pump